MAWKKLASKRIVPKSYRWSKTFAKLYQFLTPQKPSRSVRARKIPDYSTSNPADTYTRNNKYFNIHHRHTEPYKNSLCVCVGVCVCVGEHIKGIKERYLLEQKHNLQIFGVIPFVKLPNYT